MRADILYVAVALVLALGAAKAMMWMVDMIQIYGPMLR